ncbi:hypothetical protein [Paracoccus sp. ME4]|uniref:hypothetical protein n=1 Tax=Paracoccus sp. ME4 TaxID=3138066 RepID=UPI00398A7483
MRIKPDDGTILHWAEEALHLKTDNGRTMDMTRSREENATNLQAEQETATRIRSLLDEAGDIVTHQLLNAIRPAGDDAEARMEALLTNKYVNASLHAVGGVVGPNGLAMHDGRRFALADFADGLNALARERADTRLRAVRETFDTPVLETDQGNWHQVDSVDKAELASMLGETAIAHYWKRQQEDLQKSGEVSGHEWHVLIDDHGLAAVSLVALRHDLENTMEPSMLDCHVTGYRNLQVSDELKGAVRELNEARNLSIFGRKPAEPDDGPGF